MARDHALTFLRLLDGKGFAKPNPGPCSEPDRPSAAGADSPACATGSGGCRFRATPSGPACGHAPAKLHAERDESGEPSMSSGHAIRKFREAWKAAGNPGTPRASVSRSICHHQ